MESGRSHRGFDLAVIPGDGPVAGNSSASRPHLRATRDQSSSALRGLVNGAGVIRSRLKLAILAATCLVAGFLVQTNAWADSADEALARVRTLEREIAAIKQENEALRRVNKLRGENAALVKQTASNNARMAVVSASTSSNPREAYAADLPIYAKAAAPIEPGRLRVWGEGGANWSGGDPVDSFYFRTGIVGIVATSTPQYFPLFPKPGWEAAGGFDYRFAGSPWHASGQLRYGQGSTSETSSATSNLVLSGGGGPPVVVATISDSEKVSHRETHWLADLALGRDVLGSSVDSLQLKFGLRVAELRASTRMVDSASQIGGGFVISSDAIRPQETKFLGAGPRFGVEGEASIGRGWTLDYLGDAAVLMGTQRYQISETFENVVLPPGFSAPSSFNATQKFAAVFNTDVQVGVSYWVSPAAKISLSYRLDAYFNALLGLDVLNDPTKLQRLDRYTHGPRLAFSAQF
jgi:hypothetical protein